jgi:hypothetical protein
MNSSEKRRKFERFDRSMPAVIMSEKMDREVKAVTKDISAAGAFFQDVSIFEKGMKVKVELLIGNETVNKLTGSCSNLKIRGKIIRCSSGGVAIRFYDSYAVTSLSRQLKH